MKIVHKKAAKVHILLTMLEAYCYSSQTPTEDAKIKKKKKKENERRQLKIIPRSQSTVIHEASTGNLSSTKTWKWKKLLLTASTEK